MNFFMLVTHKIFSSFLRPRVSFHAFFVLVSSCPCFFQSFSQTSFTGTDYNIFIWATITFSSEIVCRSRIQSRNSSISPRCEKNHSRLFPYFFLFIVSLFLSKQIPISKQLLRDITLHFLAMKCITFIILYVDETISSCTYNRIFCCLCVIFKCHFLTVTCVEQLC